jgi:hypothetical protein
MACLGRMGLTFDRIAQRAAVCPECRMRNGFLFALIAFSLSAQSVEEPQYIDTFCALDGGKLIGLERQTVTFHGKSKVLPGYASFAMTTEVKPGQSPVRLGQAVRFIVRGRSEIDPASRFELRMLKSYKKHRDLELANAHGSIFGAVATSAQEKGSIPIRFEEYGQASYRITPEHALAPGEYALQVRGFISTVYCFGVD